MNTFDYNIWIVGIVAIGLGIHRTVSYVGRLITKLSLIILIISSFLYNINVLSCVFVKLVGLIVLGIYAIVQLLFSIEIIRKSMKIRSNDTLSWELLADFVEWSIAEQINNRSLNNQSVYDIFNNSPYLSRHRYKEQIVVNLINKSKMISEETNWKQLLVEFVDKNEKTLIEIRQSRKQLTMVLIWMTLGFIMLLFAKYLLK